ncbi:MAG: hypothetical protein J6U65_08620 [Bacteroidaceae bacterium]|nr:hypothetical protein [Bacteroidaceae bacterium]
MKKMFALLMLMTVSMSTVFAQTPDGDKAEERMNRMIERKAKDLKLDEETTAWFSPLYKEYLLALFVVNQKYRVEKKDLNDAEILESIVNSFSRAEEEVAVKRTYFLKFQEKLTPQQLKDVFMPRMNRSGQGGQRGGFNRGGGRQGFQGQGNWGDGGSNF